MQGGTHKVRIIFNTSLNKHDFWHQTFLLCQGGMEKQKQQEYAEKAEKEKKKKQNALIQSLFKTVVDI